MKKGWKLLTLCLCLFTLLGCSGKADYEKIQKDLESKGFVIDVKEDKNAIVSVNNNYAPGFNFVLVDGKVASILYINASLTEESITGIVYLNNKEMEKEISITKEAMDDYKKSLKDTSYSEDEMIDFAQWYYNEKKSN